MMRDEEMSTSNEQGMPLRLICRTCGTAMELCAFCEREDCRRAICYRCLRIQVGQALPHPSHTRRVSPWSRSYVPKCSAIRLSSEAPSSGPTHTSAISPPGRTKIVVGIPMAPVASKKDPTGSKPVG